MSDMTEAISAERPEETVALAMAELGTLATAGDPLAFELAAAKLQTRLADVRLSSAFVHAIRAQLRDLELTANMKACDLALRSAFAHPNKRRKPQRVVAVSSARFYLRRASMLGASAEFLRGAERTIAAALLTDGIFPEPANENAGPI